jgi:hypothetical protein
MPPGPTPARERSVALLDRLLLACLTAWAAASLLPLGAWTGMAPVSYYAESWRLWGGTLLLASLSSVLAIVLSGGRVGAHVRGLLALALRPGRASFLLVLGALAALESAVMADRYFARNPPLIDVWVQSFQAKIFLSGALAAPAPRSLPHFALLHTLVTDVGWFSQYPPIHPALLAVGMALGATWLVTPLLSALLPAAAYLLARRTGDERVARLAAALGLLSPFVIAMSASGMNHLPAALCVAIGLWTVPDLARGRPSAGLVFGAVTGLLAGLRPLDAGVLAAVGGAALLGQRGPGAFAAAGLAGVAALCPTLLFNAATTGNPLRFGYAALYGASLDLGFHAGPWGAALTPLRGLGFTALDAHQLNVYLLEWPLPVTLLIAAGGWLRGGRLDAALRGAAAYLLALVGLLFFYFHRDTLFGPRFLFSAVPAVLVLLSAALVALADARQPLRWRGIAMGDLNLVLLVTTALLAATLLAPRRLASYSLVGTALARHPDEDAAAVGLGRAVVLVPDGWGSRLIVRMWAAGIPMAESDRLYHAFDACTLEELLSTADDQRLDGTRLAARLHEATASATPGLSVPGTTSDPYLRLPADRNLTPRCAEELARDARGTLPFAAFAHLNVPALDGPIVWAREMGRPDGALRELYPDRPIYRYAVTSEGTPTFIPLEPSADPIASAAGAR